MSVDISSPGKLPINEKPLAFMARRVSYCGAATCPELRGAEVTG
jgi:hypothetical protein